LLWNEKKNGIEYYDILSHYFINQNTRLHGTKTRKNILTGQVKIWALHVQP